MTDMTLEEWERRFKARIVERLAVPPTEWTQDEAEDAARNEVDGLDIDLSDNPEEAADESLSYWDAE